MFIKFGDATKKIIIKESKDNSLKDTLNEKNNESQEFNTLYLDQDSEDRRVKALIDYEKEK